MSDEILNIHIEFFPSKEKKVIKLEGKPTGLELLKDLNLHLDAHILVRNDTPIPMDEKLIDGDRIKILSVVSGG